jgi:hypothetical protein
VSYALSIPVFLDLKALAKRRPHEYSQRCRRGLLVTESVIQVSLKAQVTPGCRSGRKPGLTLNICVMYDSCAGIDLEERERERERERSYTYSAQPYAGVDISLRT